MNPRIFLTLLVSLSFVVAGCVSQRSEVATKLGYEKSVKIEVGPYQLHYAHDGTNDFVLLTEGNRDLFARYTGEGTDVFFDGWPFINFERSADGSVTNFSMHVSDIHGKAKYDLVDRNADGQWDMKIDDVTGSVYVWKEGGWVERYHHAPPEKQDAQTVDNQRNDLVLFLVSLPPAGRGWCANNARACVKTPAQ